MVAKVVGTENPADARAKFLAQRELQRCLMRLGLLLDWQPPLQAGGGRPEAEGGC